ncbi:MAG TPA: CPBP family intramembrane glutamic endopeptidase [Vitreimonas sp.]|nr:CPBP family intramembrane glutamic endopeptidase [Vitreimonas sp.]
MKKAFQQLVLHFNHARSIVSKSSWQTKLLLSAIIILALINYQLAKLTQRLMIAVYPSWSYHLTISVPWFLICFLPAAAQYRYSGLEINRQQFLKKWPEIIGSFLLIMIGLVVFVLLGVTAFFHNVKSPLIFFLVTPIVEELLFRGWIYGQLEKYKLYPIMGSAMLFGLHHLQYFGYRPTPFALFQITYTLLLGLFFGVMRKKSGSIYPSLVTHIIINWVTVYF